MSPAGAFALLVLVAICTAIPSVFATRRPRIISVVLLIASIALAVSYYPVFEYEKNAYIQRVKERAAQPQITTPTEQVTSKGITPDRPKFSSRSGYLKILMRMTVYSAVILSCKPIR